MENEKFQELVLEHLAKLTQESTETKQDIQQMSQRLEHVESAVIRIENDHGDKLKALFDAREAQLDVNQQIFDALNRIEEKLDRLDLKVSAHEAVLKKVEFKKEIYDDSGKEG